MKPDIEHIQYDNLNPNDLTDSSDEERRKEETISKMNYTKKDEFKIKHEKNAGKGNKI